MAVACEVPSPTDAKGQRHPRFTPRWSPPLFLSVHTKEMRDVYAQPVRSGSRHVRRA